jgi:C1A family cysteine protease
MLQQISHRPVKPNLRKQLFLWTFTLSAFLTGVSTWADLPENFDLRDVNGTNFMTSVKSQSGGTCWTHGTMAALESNMQVTGEWKDNAETGEPNLAEYHLDWWNGFNEFNNDDLTPPRGDGLEIHMGGDYRVATAYISRGEGVVRDIDGQSYSTFPIRGGNTYHYYYPKHVEWMIDDGEASRNEIKQTIMTYGAIGTCMFWDNEFSNPSSHYQPISDDNDPNHSIAIAGWDDNKVTNSDNPGAWLCKNSWGSSWSGDGYFWISYDDKHCCKDEQMGAVSFQNVQRQTYLNFYYHDYHGWRDTLPVERAMNSFVSKEDEDLIAVSFFTATNDVDYSISVYGQFTNNVCSNLSTVQTGRIDRTGLHTIDLETKVHLLKDDKFYIVLDLSQGGQPYDKTSEIPVLLYADEEVDPQQDFNKYLETLGKISNKRLADEKTIVRSTASTNESFYWGDAQWIDLTTFDSSANFCIKGITTYPDWDDDDMPNYWEMQFNLNPTNSSDRDIDNDMDGMSNYDEWIADTNPTNINSVLNASIDMDEEQITINFNSSTQRLYRLLSSGNLSSWRDAPDCPVQLGAGSNDQIITSYTNTTATQYFKLEVKIP